MSARGAGLALALVGSLALAPSAAAQRIVLGRSVEHRPIVAYRLSDPHGHPVLIVGCVHGNERAGIAVVRLLRRLPVPANVDLWLVPVANPDGAAHDQRTNAHDVDLNRQFPDGWRRIPAGTPSGPRPLSEPESRAIHRLLLRLRPEISIWYHQHLALVDESGGSRPVELRYARLVGLPLHRQRRLPGSITTWTNHALGGSAFVVELPAGALTPRSAQRHAAAVRELAAALSVGVLAPRSRLLPPAPW